MDQGRREIKPPPHNPPENQPPNHPPPPPRKCPRCDSANTKFCYYNNYSLSQPRYFCKGCRRYWTQGGTLRNVPVGGGCRKAKRLKTASSPSVGNVTPQQPPAPTVGTAPYYQSGGTFLSPLAAMNSFSQPHTTPLGSSSSGFSLFQGFNLSPLSQPQTEFYQTMNFVQPNRPLGFWNHTLIDSNNNSSNPNPSPISGTSLNLINPFPEFPGYEPPSS